MSDKLIEIGVGEMAVGADHSIIQTNGIGSCVIVCLHDGIAKVGGMLHAMLPTRKKSKGEIMAGAEHESLGKYVDEAIVRLVEELEKIGGKKTFIKAKIIGGACMFKIFSHNNIGTDNTKSAKKVLELLNIPVEAEDIGGCNGRSARFHVDNGVAEVTIKL